MLRDIVSHFSDTSFEKGSNMCGRFLFLFCVPICGFVFPCLFHFFFILSGFVFLDTLTHAATNKKNDGSYIKTRLYYTVTYDSLSQFATFSLHIPLHDHKKDNFMNQIKNLHTKIITMKRS